MDWWRSEGDGWIGGGVREMGGLVGSEERGWG